MRLPPLSPAVPAAVATAVGGGDGQKTVLMRRNYYDGGPPISRDAGLLLVGATRAGLAGVGAGAGEFRLDLRSR